MVLESVPVGPLLWGVAFALIGVAFWSVGFVIANYLWKHYRGDDT